MKVLSDKLVLDPGPIQALEQEEHNRKCQAQFKLQVRAVKQPFVRHERPAEPDPRWRGLEAAL